MFDSDLKMEDEESESDNFDVVLETAEKIYIIRPVLRPGAISSLVQQMRIHCVEILNQIMASFLPEPIDEEGEEKTRKGTMRWRLYYAGLA